MFEEKHQNSNSWQTYVNHFGSDQTNIYLFKVNNGNTRKRCELYSKLTIKTPEGCH